MKHGTASLVREQTHCISTHPSFGRLSIRTPGVALTYKAENIS